MSRRSDTDAVLDDVVATSNVDRLKAELEVAELEDELRAAKDSGKDYEDVKYKLRDARQKMRQLRSGESPDDGVARPEPVRATVRKGK